MAERVAISVVVEGSTDESLVRRLLEDLQYEPIVYPLGGKAKLDQRLLSYNNAAGRSPWFVLRDLDRDAQCAGELKERLLPRPASQMCFRLAVRATEAWLLADAEGISSFLRVSRGKVPGTPEQIADPKQALINLARSSRSAHIREDMVPVSGGTARVGPGYLSRVDEFIGLHWSWRRAAQHASSLARCVSALDRLRSSTP